MVVTYSEYFFTSLQLPLILHSVPPTLLTYYTVTNVIASGRSAKVDTIGHFDISLDHETLIMSGSMKHFLELSRISLESSLDLACHVVC